MSDSDDYVTLKQPTTGRAMTRTSALPQGPANNWGWDNVRSTSARGTCTPAPKQAANGTYQTISGKGVVPTRNTVCNGSRQSKCETYNARGYTMPTTTAKSNITQRNGYAQFNISPC